MSNINIENLSYDMNMDREAMDAIAGGAWYNDLFSGAKKLVSKYWKPVAVAVLTYFGSRWSSPR
jgi:hypothetical protein